MQTLNTFNQMASKPDFNQTLKMQGMQTAADLNCMRIGIIQEFYPEDLTVDVLITNKKTKRLNVDGTQDVRDFPLIRAKVCYCNPFETFPLKQGDECVLLFADREIESWFINGDANPEGYSRMHSLTDAVAIVGIRSLPNIINILADCLNLFYGNSNIAISEDLINITAQTVQTANLQAMNGASGNIVDSQGKILAKVEHGIITQIF